MDPLVPGAPVNRIQGVVIGIVIDNKDPESLYRVKVKFPWVKESSGDFSDAPDREDFPSSWARIATLMGGKDRGSYWLPEVGDEVLVAFEHGDLRRPFVIGCLWNPVDKTIHNNDDGKNNFRTLFSRSGNVLQFIDEEGKERIVLQTKVAAGEAATAHKSRSGHFIVLDSSGGSEKIEIYDGKQENYVLLDSANNNIEVKSANGNIKLNAPNGKVEIECKELVTHASTNTTVKTDSALKIQAGSSGEVTTSSTLTIKGSQVKIN